MWDGRGIREFEFGCRWDGVRIKRTAVRNDLQQKACRIDAPLSSHGMAHGERNGVPRETRGRVSLLLVTGSNSNVAIFHLTAIAFQPDGTGGRQLKFCFQNLAIARAASGLPGDHNFQLIPLLRSVVL